MENKDNFFVYMYVYGVHAYEFAHSYVWEVHVFACARECARGGLRFMLAFFLICGGGSYRTQSWLFQSG